VQTPSTSGDGGRISVPLRVIGEQRGSSCRDNGIGIADEFRRAHLERFRQQIRRPSAPSAVWDSGLRSSQLVELHGGCELSGKRPVAIRRNLFTVEIPLSDKVSRKNFGETANRARSEAPTRACRRARSARR
jgi:hypothetical protein